jgi:diacylglycerol kinase family enzyme
MAASLGNLCVFLNPAANRGGAGSAWAAVEPQVRAMGWGIRCETPGSAAALPEAVARAVREGETFLVAAGGDGTLQNLLDAIMTRTSPEERSRLRLGAIGIGTSNDFHKPLEPRRQVAGFPCRLNPEESVLSDVVKLVVTDATGGTATRYLLQSSHLGTIPAANVRLTQGKGLFGFLYRLWYKAALMVVSAYEVFTYPGFTGEISAGGQTWKGAFSGMSLLKRAHVAGSFVFKTARTADDGKFDLALCDKVTPFRLIALIDEFEKKGMAGHPEVHFQETSQVTARFDTPQPVDFDGEILLTKSAEWSVLPKHLLILG